MSESDRGRWVIKDVPTGALTESHFEWQADTSPSALELGDVRVETAYVSLDPTNRVWFLDESYLPPLRAGDVMRGVALGRVTESRNDSFEVGDEVQGLWGWRTGHVSNGEDLMKIHHLPGVPLVGHFSLLGHIGLAAYHGIVKIGEVSEGDVVVVSAAAGAVGSLAGQIAKNRGATVIGIAGSDEKCQRLAELGFDTALNYRSADFQRSLADACATGVDVYFDNVGGWILDSMLGHLKNHSRIVGCGMMADYNKPEIRHAFKNLTMLVNKRIAYHGFIITDHLDLAAEAYPVMIEWNRQGTLEYRVDVVHGLRSAPQALARLFDGTNSGKLVVEVKG